MPTPFSDYLNSPAMAGAPQTNAYNQAKIHNNCITYLNLLMGYANRSLRRHGTIEGVLDECGVKKLLQIGNAFYQIVGNEVMTRTTIERDGVILDFHAFLHLHPGMPGLGFLVFDLGLITKNGTLWVDQHINGWCNVRDDDEEYIDVCDCSVEELPGIFQRVKDANQVLKDKEDVRN